MATAALLPAHQSAQVPLPMDTALNLERCGLKEEEADGLLAYLQHTNHTVRPKPATRAILALSRLKSESRGKCGALGADRPDVGGRKPGAEGLATNKALGPALDGAKWAS